MLLGSVAWEICDLHATVGIEASPSYFATHFTHSWYSSSMALGTLISSIAFFALGEHCTGHFAGCFAGQIEEQSGGGQDWQYHRVATAKLAVDICVFFLEVIGSFSMSLLCQ